MTHRHTDGRRLAIVSWTVLALLLVRAPFAHALPDIAPEISAVAVDFDATVDPGDVAEGCAGATTGRVLVNFTTTTHSLGPDDLYMGNPGCPDCALHPGAPCANPLYVCSTAHGHPHFESFAAAELLDSNGVVVVTGSKQGFCLEDFGCAHPQYDCGNQGITVGCVDVYSAGLPCQYVDITDANLPDGDYTLRVTQDPENVIAEANENNNVATATVHLGPPSIPPPTMCPVYVATDLPQAIVDLGTTTSTVHDPRAGVVERVRVVDLHGTHTYMQDLGFTVASPSGTSVVVMDHVCGDTDDFRLDLADGALTPIPCPPNVGGLHQPSEALAAFLGQPAAGDWTLTVADTAGGDVGSLEGWGLEVCTKCGNGTVDPGEVCDDGNAADGDCCSSSCQTAAPNGTACDDPHACTIAGACLGGACDGGTVSCDPCLTCDPPLGCVPPTNVQCDIEPPRSASVTLAKHASGPSFDTLTWKWQSSLPVALLDYGSPTTVSDLILCVFDQTGLKLSAIAPAAGTCRGRPCWKAGTSSLKYNDHDATPDGILKLTASAGQPGQARISLRGKGANLAMPALGLAGQVTVRLKRDVGPVCWQSRFPTANRNDAKQYRASIRH
jgi:cysteine-rich repeat protein